MGDGLIIEGIFRLHDQALALLRLHLPIEDVPRIVPLFLIQPPDNFTGIFQLLFPTVYCLPQSGKLVMLNTSLRPQIRRVGLVDLLKLCSSDEVTSNRSKLCCALE